MAERYHAISLALNVLPVGVEDLFHAKGFLLLEKAKNPLDLLHPEPCLRNGNLCEYRWLATAAPAQVSKPHPETVIDQGRGIMAKNILVMPVVQIQVGCSIVFSYAGCFLS